ncbi:hypothetical protein DFH08DRAFT_973481 [Mycena albidolilacea]|uniref:Uncharacterized protein n=1 Tax=Mycena albidolilacea TaxID=1033008 RepID=A0AAD7ECE4_9AGAR|nr:hypothetical protein DFH08DRAFT_973481 [Mycena albidolilacea]
MNKPITPEHLYFDFELQIPLDTSVDFTSYYTTIENHLYFDLTIPYSLDITKCIKPDSKLPEEEPTIDDAAKTEEVVGLVYASWAAPPVHITLAIVPPAHPVEHHLLPGAPVPVLRSRAQVQMPDMLPVAQPIFTEEALANTSARLMQVGLTDPFHLRQHFMNMTCLQWWGSHPTKDYRGGNYEGLL